MFQEICLNYFREFLSCVPGDVTQYAEMKKSLILPILPLNFVNQLVENVTNIFKYEPTLLNIYSPVTIVGDLHGHLLDLFRILKTCGSPEARKFLFLGDIVDRGEFSVETVILIYLLKICWPKNVYIIRGNHEFQYLSSQCGFLAQLSVVYGDNLIFGNFMKSFSYMPLAAIIDSTALCVHGGLSPALSSVAQIRKIQRPFDYFGDDQVIDGILWSDPSTYVEDYQTSPRGTGYLFSEKNVKKFLQENHLKYIIRGHECVPEGININFDSVITVFSASNYCGIVKNDGAILNFKKNGTFDKKVLPKMQYMLRGYAMFKKEKYSVSDIKMPASARVVPKPHIHNAITKPVVKTPRLTVVKENHPTFHSPIQRRMRF